MPFNSFYLVAIMKPTTAPIHVSFKDMPELDFTHPHLIFTLFNYSFISALHATFITKGT